NCGDCEFEGTMCGWSNYATRNMWTVLKPAYNSPLSMPKRDADESSYGGYATNKTTSNVGMYRRYTVMTIVVFIALVFLNVYLFIFINSVRSQLHSPRINGRTAPGCKLQFSYLTNRGATLYVNRFRQGQTFSMFSLKGSVPVWRSYQVEIGGQYGGF